MLGVGCWVVGLGPRHLTPNTLDLTPPQKTEGPLKTFSKALATGGAEAEDRSTSICSAGVASLQPGASRVSAFDPLTAKASVLNALPEQHRPSRPSPEGSRPRAYPNSSSVYGVSCRVRAKSYPWDSCESLTPLSYGSPVSSFEKFDVGSAAAIILSQAPPAYWHYLKPL